MSTSDDLSSGPLDAPTSRDPMVDRLYREAMRERPTVSPGLHRQILNRIDAQRPARRTWWQGQTSRWFARIAAAALIAAGIWAAWWTMHALGTTTSGPPPTFVDKSVVPPSGVSFVPANPAPPNLSVDVGGIIFATAWPPQVSLVLAGIEVSPTPQPLDKQPPQAKPAPGLPELMLAGLEEPTNSANAALAELVPPDIQAWVRMLRDAVKENQD